MTSQPSQQELAQFSQSKGYQTFGHLIEYNKRNIFLKKIMPKMRQEDQFQIPFCFFEKAVYKVKTSGLRLSFNSPQLSVQ